MDGLRSAPVAAGDLGGVAGIGVRVPVLPVAEKVKVSLEKLYRDKAMTVDLDVATGLAFRGAEGDLIEVLGNLLDNACKWGRRQVRLAASRNATGLHLCVEDDGPGIDPGLAEWLSERGARADERVPGHGIGLAMVRDIVVTHGGDLSIGRSALGGAAVTARVRD